MAPSLIQAIAFFIIFIYSVVLHELAHGLMARSLGDPTAEQMGRLTLNPLKHLDLFGSVILPIMLGLMGSPFLFGYAKPVPYNPHRLSDQKYGPAKVALAGPATNLLLAILAGIIIRLAGSALSQPAFELIGYIVWINIVLAFFNLMPIPPLDGHWLLMTFLPARLHELRAFLFRYQWLLVVALIFFVFPLLTPVMAGLFKILTGARLF